VAFLPAVPANFRSRHAFDADRDQGLLYRIQFGRLYDRFNFFHSSHPFLFSDHGRPGSDDVQGVPNTPRRERRRASKLHELDEIDELNSARHREHLKPRILHSPN
jgi:hypothetical protein